MYNTHLILGIQTLFADAVTLAELDEKTKQEVLKELYQAQEEQKYVEEHIAKYKYNSRSKIIDTFKVPNGNVLYIIEVRGQYFIMDPYKTSPEAYSWASRLTPLK
jgi:proline dehydrogenase